MEQYSVKEEVNPATGATEFIVVDSAGIKVPPPNTFATKDAALVRLAEVLSATLPSPKMVCYGKIVAASDSMLIQSLGMDRYVQHRRADSDAFAEIKEDDLVRIIGGEVEYPERNRRSGLCL